MPISWYSSKPKQSVDVKLTKSSIVITDSGVGKLLDIDPRFDDATHVKLGWDQEDHLIAIAPAGDNDKDVFKIGRRGRSKTNRTINAAKFYEHFGLTINDDSLDDAVLRSVNGTATFKIKLPQLDVISTNGAVPARRHAGGRPRKIAA